MRRLIFLTACVAALFVLPASASALTVSKAQLSKGQVQIEGAGAQPGIFVIANSSTSSAGIRSDGSGAFKINATGFVSNDCTAVVSDGSTPIAVPVLSGCTPVAPKPVSTTLPPPTGSCTITPDAAATYHVGDQSTFYFDTTGCIGGPLQWSVVAGAIPRGMSGPIFQGQTAGEVDGRPVTEGTYIFTLKATDSLGQTDVENFTISVVAPRAISILPAILPAGLLSSPYQVNLTADGGLPGYLWTLNAGTLPPGMSLTRNMLAGRPTARGTYTFTLRATDSRAASGNRTYSLVIN